VLGVLALSLSVSTPNASAATTPQLDGVTYDLGSNSSLWSNGGGNEVMAMANGEYWVANEGSGVIRVFDSSGTFLRQSTYAPNAIHSMLGQLGGALGHGDTAPIPQPNGAYTLTSSEAAAVEQAAEAKASDSVKRGLLWKLIEKMGTTSIGAVAARASGYGFAALTLYQLGSMVFHSLMPGAPTPAQTVQPIGFATIPAGDTDAYPHNYCGPLPSPATQTWLVAVYPSGGCSGSGVVVQGITWNSQMNCQTFGVPTGFQVIKVADIASACGNPPAANRMLGFVATPFLQQYTDAPHPPGSNEPSPTQTVTVSPVAPKTGSALSQAENDALNDPANAPIIEDGVRALGGLPGQNPATTCSDCVPPDPTWGRIPVPLSNDTYGTYASALTAAGFATHHRIILSTADADLTKPAGAIITVSPTPGHLAAPSTDVAVTTNPDTLPVLVPAPLHGETYDLYIARLQGLGLVGQVTTLSDAQSDPTLGGRAVVRTDPLPGTRAVTGTTVRIYSNPDDGTTTQDGTTTGGGGGPPVGPDLPGFHFLSIPTPCNVFPFGAPCWLYNQLQSLDSTAQAPHVSLTDLGVPWSIDAGHPFGMNDVQGWMGIVKPVLVFVSFVGFFIWLAGFALGGGTEGGGSAGTEE
jgi:hypothetical protein